MQPRHIDLGGGQWQVGAVPDQATRAITTRDIGAVETWLPATVPGNVRADLLAAGLIPDPFTGRNNEASQWVETHDWWYRREFPLHLDEGKRAFLVFDGVDYFSAVYLDDELLGSHEGMFSRQVYEITARARGAAGAHRLAVRLLGPAHFPRRDLSLFERAWDYLSRRLSAHNSAFTARLDYLKCQMGFGWDFAPRMRTIGIWDQVTLFVSGTVWIRDIRVRTAVESDGAALGFTVQLDSAGDVPVSVQLEIRERDSGSLVLSGTRDAALHAGQQNIETTLVLENPHLWQPWDRGTAHLYDLTVRVARHGNAGGDVLDCRSHPFGIRAVAMTHLRGSPRNSEPWLLTINGQPEFIRGANWVPLDALPGRIQASDYEQMLDQAIGAGINMLRVWGGGLREKAAFYDCCDRKGMLVWQDFPFACAFLGYFRRDPLYLELVRQECAEIVRQLRDHPSVALWCGGNEFSPRRNHRLIAVLRNVVTQEDGTRPFKRVSPDRQENHNWRVWHGRRPVADYRQERSSVLGEFGLQAIPNLDSLRKFIPEQDLWPPGAEWEYHNAEIEKLLQYARPLLPAGTDLLESGERDTTTLEALIAASQQAQAHGLQVAVEHMRRRKGRTSGILLWQLNEPWPAICWSIIDYYRQPKAAYQKLCTVYNPVLLSAAYPLRRYERGDRLSIELWVINDRLEPLESAFAEAVLDGETILHCAVSVPADSSRRIAHTLYTLDHTPQRLCLSLTGRSGEVLSANEYNLTYVETHGLHWRPYLTARLVELLMRW